MTAVYTLNLIDRGVMMLLLQPIKEDLQLSDSQLGLVTGIAFGVFYATLGLPIARWADRGNRVTITSLAIGIWGLTAMAALAVTSFLHLLLIRITAAVGEAGCKPPTYSMLGDYFPAPAERSRAVAIYFAGGPLSALVSFMIGGLLNELYGWRMTFLLMGIPGLLLAVLVKLTLIEPRIAAQRAEAAQTPMPPLREVLAMLWHRPTCRHLTIALILLFTMGMGLGPWKASFMIRSHGMSTGELGIWLGLINGLGGMAGVLLGGYVAARWFVNKEGKQMIMSALTIGAMAPFFIGFLTLQDPHHALIALIPYHVALGVFMGPTYALLQRLVPDQMRATTLSAVMLLANLIGMGVGPQLVGVLSDLFAPTAGQDALRYAMLCMSFISIWSGYHFWKVSRTVRDDLAARDAASTQTVVAREHPERRSKSSTQTT
jgi:MFS family permease